VSGRRAEQDDTEITGEGDGSQGSTTNIAAIASLPDSDFSRIASLRGFSFVFSFLRGGLHGLPMFAWALPQR